MKTLHFRFAAVVAVLTLSTVVFSQSWPQWAQNPQHTGFAPVIGQNPARQLADVVYDPFVAQEQAENGGELLAHYQAPLVDGQDVFMEFKSGTYNSCNPPGSYAPFPCGNDNWFNQTWNEKRLHWEGGQLVTKWTFASDWKPAPDAGGELGGWEPVFHAALTEESVFVPGSGGTVYKLNRGNGKVKAHYNPFGTTIDPNAFVSGPLTADEDGNIYYNVLKLNITSDPNTNDPWSFGPSFNGTGVTDIPNAWLVKISAEGDDEDGSKVSKVSYKGLISGAPTTCNATFGSSTLPWPPSPTATPRTVTCLSQRPGLNISPAVAEDGTIYSVTVAHNPFASRYAYVVAFHPNLTLKWAASMRDRIHDGCGVLVPIATASSPAGCRAGQPANGVDPATNEAPAGRVIDQSSSTPVIAPDGSVLYGAYTRYNYARGHLFRFSSTGQFLAAYDFGWDSTPAIYAHGGTFSAVIKDNHYDAGSYCNDPVICPVAPKGPYFMTQLNANLVPEWMFKNTSTDATHNNGFEWCINQPAIDATGTVYANSEDGSLYVIKPGGTLKGKLFLKQAIGAAYTPLALGEDGKIYTENDGHLFVAGN